MPDITWLAVVAAGLGKLKESAVMAGMPEEEAVRIFAEALDKAAGVYLEMKTAGGE